MESQHSERLFFESKVAEVVPGWPDDHGRPSTIRNLEDQEMVGKRMWAVETTSHETVRDAGHLHFIDPEPAGVSVLLKCEVAGSHYTFQMPLPLLKKEGVQPTKPFLFLRPADGKHLNSVQHEAVICAAFSSTEMLTANR